MEIIKRLYKQAVVIAIPLAALSFLIDRKMPLSILLGAFLALLNLKGLSHGVKNLLSSTKATLKLVILSLLRLTLVFAALVLLALSRMVNLIGLLIGLTIVFGLLLKEGLRASKEMDDADAR